MLVTALFMLAAAAPTAFESRDQLMEAIGDWCVDPLSAEAKHGPVSDWDVSEVTNMAFLFCGLPEDHAPWAVKYGCRKAKQRCNPDIARWNVAKVTNMVRSSR
jgi:hypothetical protein